MATSQVYPDRGYLDALRADLVRIHGEFSVPLLLRSLLLHRTFRPLASLRLCQAAASSRTPALRTAAGIPLRAVHRWVTGRAGIDLSWRTPIGAGAKITHGWGLVVSPGARIGRNVTLFHGVTIGRKEDIAPDGSRSISFPTIEDDVWIGHHATVIGGVTVGRGSRIAPHALVMDDVPTFAIVGGNPMRVLREDAVPDVKNRVPFA